MTGLHSRAWFGGFLLLGVLLGGIGSLLVVWKYHLQGDPSAIGLHFLALNCGYVAGAGVAQPLLRRISGRYGAILGCAVAAGSLTALTVSAPPPWLIWRLLALTLLGASGGILFTALLYALERDFKDCPALAVNRSGALFAGGCLLANAVIGVGYVADRPQAATGLLISVPLIYALVYASKRNAPRRSALDCGSARNSVRDLRRVAVVLVCLLLFFQFWNEWAIGGWLPLFLIRRLGTNPGWAIFALTFYFLVLIAGRFLAGYLLRRLSHRRLLLSGTLAALSGFVLLSSTGGLIGAYLAIALIGIGFGPIFPLLAEYLDERFSYQPRFYSGVFAIAVTGAFSAPWLLGYVDAYLGIRYVMLIPALGSIAVLILERLIIVEARLMSGSAAAPTTFV